MLGGGFKSERLRVNLRLVINRLKLLEKKKSKFYGAILQKKVFNIKMPQVLCCNT